MPVSKSEIIARLKRDILPLGGLPAGKPDGECDTGLGFMKESFAHEKFPLGAIHEFITGGPESAAATAGFMAGLLSTLMKSGGAAVWIRTSETIFPPALNSFGIEPDRILFVSLKKEKDILWAMEEALKCNSLSAVIGEMSGLSFTSSRRFQLAVEQSRVTGFIVRSQSHQLQPNACVSRWKIEPLPSLIPDDLPGIGYPRWQVNLLKIRNGKSGSWQIEWSDGKFQPVMQNISLLLPEPKRKTG